MASDVEKIHALKFRYLRGLDTQDIELIASCFAEDAEVGFDDGKYSAAGKEAIVELMRGILAPGFFSVHSALHPEIEIAGDRASGRWRLQTLALFTDEETERYNAGYYADEYVRQGEDWLIARSGYKLAISSERSWAGEGAFTLSTFPARGV